MPATAPSLAELSPAFHTEPDLVPLPRVLFPSLAKGDGSCTLSVSDDGSSTIDYSVYEHTTTDCTSVDGDIRTYDGEEMTYGYTETTRGGFSGAFYYDERSAQERTYASETKDDKETDDDEEETDDDEDLRTDEGSRADDRDFFYDTSDDGPSKVTKATTEDVNIIHSCHETFVTAPTDALRHLFYFRGTSTAPPQAQGPEATSNPNKQIEFLQRDCKMLKEIIARDSKHSLHLTGEVDSLRSSSGRSVLEKEIEDLRQREKNMLKEMEALQMDLNNDSFMEMEASELKSNEIKRLQLQCKMFSFHIVQLEKENQDLTKENATLRRTFSPMDRSESIREIIPMKTIEMTSTDGSLRAHVTSLVHRFSEIEEYMASRDKAQGEQCRTLQALESIEDATIPFVYSSSELSSPEKRFDSAIVEDDPCLLLQACSQDEDVEVTLDGLIIATSRIEDHPQPGKGTGPSTANSTGPSFCCFDSSCE
jgi:hypothetical protein